MKRFQRSAITAQHPIRVGVGRQGWSGKVVVVLGEPFSPPQKSAQSVYSTPLQYLLKNFDSVKYVQKVHINRLCFCPKKCAKNAEHVKTER